MNAVVTKNGPRRLLWNLQGKVYYKGGGEWTPDPAQARSFDDVEEITGLAKYCRLQNAEIVVQSGNGDPDVHIPVGESPLSGSVVSEEAPVATQPEDSPGAVARSKTTGELIEEVEHERDAAKFELLQSQMTVTALRQQTKR